VAWVLVRYEFPAKRIIDALVDLPFALPTAVAGIALTALNSHNGWIGQHLPFKVSFTPIGVFVALTFIGLPFVVRTLQPVLEELHKELEEAAATLGADRWQTFRHVLFPILSPALLTGFALAFARALGEYGSVIFIAGNMPMVSEITPLLIITKLEQYDYAGATAVATVMLFFSFVHAAGHQRAASLAAPPHGSPGMSANISARRAQAGTTEPAWVRYSLIGIALVFIFLFLILPLAAVFTEALRKGLMPSWKPSKNPMPGAPSA